MPTSTDIYDEALAETLADVFKPITDADANRKAKSERIRSLTAAIEKTRPSFRTETGGGSYAGGVAAPYQQLRGEVVIDIGAVAELLSVGTIDGSELESAVESVCRSKADRELNVHDIDECIVTGPGHEFAFGDVLVVFEFSATGESVE